jgi:apolipoprotein N-acyltransferase
MSARLNLNSPGVIVVHGQRAAILVCYEQLITWPVLISMAQRPTVLVAVANDYWVADTPIPSFQLTAVRAWARLFRLPYFSAVNT